MTLVKVAYQHMRSWILRKFFGYIRVSDHVTVTFGEVRAVPYNPAMRLILVDREEPK